MPRRSLEGLVKKYFLKGYPYRSILIQLGLLNGISISLSQLKRIVKRLGLRRRTRITFSYLTEVETLIRGELDCSSISLGYRALWRRLRRKYRIPLSRNTVMELLRYITPGETERRKRKRLRRRTFHIKGPNEVWSIDGYDKLKPFGFAIHGCIDAYSRRVLWLKVCSTNSDPKVIAWYYLKCVKMIKGAPKLLCSDLGTENSIVSFIQPFLRGVVTSFRYVKSVSNQRIEAFWSILRRWCTDWWIDFFYCLLQDGQYEECNFIHCDSLRFCFMHIIQKELDDVRSLWNTHHIRQSTSNTISGIPNLLYDLPVLNGTRDYKCDVNTHNFRYAAIRYAHEPPPPVSLEYLRAAYITMTDNNITSMPSDNHEALHLYILLTTTFACYI